MGQLLKLRKRELVRVEWRQTRDMEDVDMNGGG